MADGPCFELLYFRRTDVTLHSYRTRWGEAESGSRSGWLEDCVKATKTLSLPTISLHGAADGVNPTSAGKNVPGKFDVPFAFNTLEGVGRPPHWTTGRPAGNCLLRRAKIAKRTKYLATLQQALTLMETLHAGGASETPSVASQALRVTAQQRTSSRHHRDEARFTSVDHDDAMSSGQSWNCCSTAGFGAPPTMIFENTSRGLKKAARMRPSLLSSTTRKR